MKYSGSLVKKERELIFKLFLDKNKLKFNEIEKAIKIRSNMISYHLERMQEEEIIEKIKNYYKLTKTSERYIPIFSNIIGEQLSPLPVLLVALMNKDKILLIKRNKRPYKDYWSLIGGKMLLEESFEQASLRLIKQKSSIDCKFKSINAVIHEVVEGEGIIKYSFILFFTKAITNESLFQEAEYGQLKWFNLNQLKKEKVIPSDYWLIKNKLNSKVDIENVNMKEDNGELTSFKIT